MNLNGLKLNGLYCRNSEIALVFKKIKNIQSRYFIKHQRSKSFHRLKETKSLTLKSSQTFYLGQKQRNLNKEGNNFYRDLFHSKRRAEIRPAWVLFVNHCVTFMNLNELKLNWFLRIYFTKTFLPVSLSCSTFCSNDTMIHLQQIPKTQC